MKTQILAALGENGLQQASALNAGLAANDRVKYPFFLLQMATEHAKHPEQPASTLKQDLFSRSTTRIWTLSFRAPGKRQTAAESQAPRASLRGSATPCA